MADFLGITPAQMKDLGIVGSMKLDHPDIESMHRSIECLLAKLKTHGTPGKMIEALRPNVLITGETGTGKELVAKALLLRLQKEGILDHRDPAYASVNCACLPPQLLEVELFGNAAGAFSDARNRPGLVPRLAGYKGINEEGLIGKPTGNPALLFLDEIGAADRQVQAKLLRLLENREFIPLGVQGQAGHARNLIILSATNELSPHVPTRASAGAEHLSLHQPPSPTPETADFRSDLRHRLGDTFHFHLPTLAQRPAEIAVIAEQFYQWYHRLFFDPQKSGQPLPDALKNVLLKCSWPGNGRQLHQVIRRAMILWDGSEEQDLSSLVSSLLPSLPADPAPTNS